MEARVDELYERVLPAIGAIKVIMIVSGFVMVTAQGIAVLYIADRLAKMQPSATAATATSCQHTASAR